jgi:ABC-type branched-subunit amino acid transport system ATPase component
MSYELELRKGIALRWLAKQLCETPKMLLTDEVRTGMPVYLSDLDILSIVERDNRISSMTTTYNILKCGLEIDAVLVKELNSA